MLHRKALRKSIWGSISRVIGVALGVAAGQIIHQLVGDSINQWVFAFFMAIGSFAFMGYAEYNKETAMLPSSERSPALGKTKEQ
jgi:hypothetical protein